jgi:flagellar M-ring protein FliF
VNGQEHGWQAGLKNAWGRLTSLQRAGIIGAGVVALALAFYAVILAQQPDYATLFSGLSDQDAADVVDQLKSLKIPYQLAQNGSAIQVPQREVYDVRLDMAKQGLPKGSTVGFELFDSSQLGNLGMTDFMQKLDYQRALEGELARTIDSLDPVASAKVNLVIPDANIYTSQQDDPSASIVVQLKPDTDLTRGQIQAVTHLVASSVEGLKPDNITLVDTAGNVLSEAGSGDTASSSLQGGSSQLDIEHSYESDLEKRLQAVLDQAIGPGQGIVRVSATLNWDQKQTSSETYAPVTDNTGVVRSQQVDEETSNGSGLAPSGVPGQNSNSVPIYPASEAITNSGYSKRDVTTNYELSKVTQTVTQAPGSVKRLSLAVLLSDSLPADQATRLQTVLATAAGLDTSRGDTIAVERVAFNTASSSTAASAPALAENSRQATIMSLLKLGGIVLALLLLLRFARLTFSDLSNRLTGGMAHVTVLEDDYLRAGRVPQLPQGSPAQALAEEAQPEAGAGLPPELPAYQPSKEDNLRAQLVMLANKRPDLIADLIQNWLAEG